MVNKVIQKAALENWIESDWQRSKDLIKSSLDLSKFTDQLPDRAGLYAIVEKGKILYIGRSEKSIRKRWKSHHKEKFLKFLVDHGYEARLFFWSLPNLESGVADYNYKKIIRILEQNLINYINPELNNN